METYIEEDIHSNVPNTMVQTDFLVQELVRWNEKVSRDVKKRAAKEYWQEIEAMNKNIPDDLELARYQSHNARIIEMAYPSCYKFKYIK